MVAEEELSEEEREAAEGFTFGGTRQGRGRGAEGSQSRVEIGAPNFPRSPEGQAARAAHERERRRLEKKEEARKESEFVAQMKVVEERGKAAERYRASRKPDAFRFQITRKTADPDSELELGLFDTDGAPLTRFVGKGSEAKEIPVLLSEYVPELSDTKLFKGIKLEPSGDAKFPSALVDDQKILRLSPAVLKADGAKNVLIPILIQAINEKSRAKLEAAEAKFEAEKAKLLKKDEKEKRIEGFEEVEKAYRTSVEHILKEREHRLEQILALVSKEQHVDLASSHGGTAEFLKMREKAHEQWKEERFIFPEHRKEKKWHSAVTDLPGAFARGVRVEQALLEKKYEKLEQDIKALPEGKWNNIRKSDAMKAFRDVRCFTRKAAQWVKPAITNPLYAGATVGGAILIGLGKLGKYVFEKPWSMFKELANEFSFGWAFKDDGHGGGAPKKKSGGGGGGHH